MTVINREEIKAEYIQGTIDIIQFRIFCLAVSHHKTWRLKYTKR